MRALKRLKQGPPRCNYPAINHLFSFAALCALTLGNPSPLQAGDGSSPAVPQSNANAGDRFGLFDGLDRRSSYGTGLFPEPFLVDDSDLEVNEFRLDWLQSGARSSHSSFGRVELEKGFGELTVELEVPYQRDSDGGEVVEGMSNVNLGARYPLYQYVGRSGDVDTTFGVGIEFGIPTHSSQSKNAEIVPKVFNDTKAGPFTLQTVIGYSALYGGGPERGVQTVEYGLVLGCPIPHQLAPIPNLQQLIPVFELQGSSQINKSAVDRTALLGNIGFRANLKAIGRFQPRLGLGYVFPMNDGARNDLHWGVFTSLVFDF